MPYEEFGVKLDLSGFDRDALVSTKLRRAPPGFSFLLSGMGSLHDEEQEHTDGSSPWL